MWKMILLQAVYQLAVIFTLHYGDFEVFNPDRSDAYLRTLTFNTFIFMQVSLQARFRFLHFLLHVKTNARPSDI